MGSSLSEDLLEPVELIDDVLFRGGVDDIFDRAFLTLAKVSLLI